MNWIISEFTKLNSAVVSALMMEYLYLPYLGEEKKVRARRLCLVKEFIFCDNWDS